MDVLARTGKVAAIRHYDRKRRPWPGDTVIRAKN